MTTHDFILAIIEIIIRFLVPIIAVWLSVNFSKLMKSRIGNENYQKLMDTAYIAVRAIEAKLGSGGGAEKKRQVEIWLANKIKWATPDDIDAVIDAIWFEMNEVQKANNKKE